PRRRRRKGPPGVRRRPLPEARWYAGDASSAFQSASAGAASAEARSESTSLSIPSTSLRSLSAAAGSLAAGAGVLAAGGPGWETELEELWSRSPPARPQPASTAVRARPAAASARILRVRRCRRVTAAQSQLTASQRSATCSGDVRTPGDDVGGGRYLHSGAK